MENEYTIKADYICQLYPKKDNDIPYGYRIVKVLVKDCSLSDANIYIGKKIVINGELPQLKIDGDYQFTVKSYIDNKYGLSFKVTNIKYETELKTEYDARKYFENKFKTAPVQYSKLVESGVDMLDLLKNNDVEKLSSIIGNKTKAEKVLNEYKNNKDQANIISGLSKYNLSNNAIKKLIDKYGNSEKAIQEINSDVYNLMEIDGYGFKKADECFLKGGGNPLSPKRIKAYIMSYLHEEAENGNSWIKSNVFTHQMYTIFGESLDRQVFGDVLKELESNKKVYYDRENKRIALMSIYKLECRIANEFKRIMNNKLIKHEENWEEIIENVQIAQGWDFTDEQLNGIEVAMNNSLVLITGLSGCGKTSVVKGLTSVYPNNINLIQCALSGCASQRIKQTSGNVANTIHKTLGINFETGGFLHNKDNPLNADIVILDEASMVSGSLFYSLLCAIGDDTKLVILGDYGQLESIGNCNVFFDLIKSDIPVVKLTKIHRQAQASAIISKSIGIRNKQQLFDKDFRGRVVLGELQDLELNIDAKDKLQSYAVRQYVHYAKKLGVENVMGVTAMRERGQLSCYELNNIIQGILIEDKTVSITRKLSKDKEYKFYIGDLVINTKNNYKAMDILENQTAIFNGNTGIVKSIENGTMIVSFFDIGDIVLEKDDINNLELAYFITCHKVQGSQKHTVIVALDYSAYTMLCNELLYTAITRAMKYCVLVGENLAIRKAISTSKTSVKNTFLCELLENKSN